MRIINEKQRHDRISSILDAAEVCFARSGFHGTSVQQICAEAGMSQGNLYRYFASKEALVAGLCKRDMQELTDDIEKIVESGDTWPAITELARRNLLERSYEDLSLWIETTAEATRNPAIAEISAHADHCITEGLRRIFTVAQQRGEISPAVDIDLLARYSVTFFMGLVMQRVKNPAVDVSSLLEMQARAMQALTQQPMLFNHPFPLQAASAP